MKDTQNEVTNSFYSKEAPKVKDYFKLIKKNIEDNEPNFTSLIDVGCATGDFLCYMHDCYKDEKKYCGVDNYDALMDIARERLGSGIFIHGDIYDGIENIKADIVCMSGVLSLFEDYKKVFKNLLALVNEHGTLYVFSIFNTNAVRVQHKFWNEGIEGSIMEFSTKEVGKWLEEQNLEYEFIPFRLTTEIERVDDPIRTYTVELKDGRLGTINGLNVWHDFYLLRIKK